MVALKALFDTNILIDYLNGIVPARDELKRYDCRLISLITWMEVMIGCRSGEEEPPVRRFLASFDLLPIDADIAERAVTLRRDARIRLPDAIIWATAQQHSALLVTRNTKDFSTNLPGIRLPYQL